LTARAYLTSPEGGRKVLRVEQADRMTEEAADVLLKALEEPPDNTTFILSSARPDEIPETVRSRCHTVTFSPLSESFVAEALAGEGIEAERAKLAARIAGGNLGRARRLAADPEGLAFRDSALEALASASSGPGGALDAAERLVQAAGDHRKRFAGRLAEDLELFRDPETGRPLEQYRGAVRRLEQRHARQERRAERDFLDAALQALEAWFRDVLLVGSGGDPAWSINLDHPPEGVSLSLSDAARAIQVLEEARAALADETNLNPRLVLEDAFLQLAPATARG
jgi:DNA polymerase-3 subunit delta'